MTRVLALLVLIAVLAVPTAAFAQEDLPPDQDQSEQREPVEQLDTAEAPADKQPTERFVYLAVGLLLLFLLYAGVAYVRTVIRTAET